jgi:hypothetical protein
MKSLLLILFASLAQAADTPIKLDPLKTDCDSVCGDLLSLNKKQAGGDEKKMMNQVWTASDDAWCGAHGVSTSSKTLEKPESEVVSVPGCPYTVTKADLDEAKGDPNAACNSVHRYVRRCQLHNSQVEPQCLAYSASNQGKDLQMIMLALDITGTGICTGSCMAWWEGPVAEGVCKYTSMAAAVTELLGVISMNQSPVGKAISGLASSATLVNAVNPEIVESGAKSVGAMLSKTKPVDKIQDQLGGGGKRGSACFTAAMLGVMTGVRAYNLLKVDKTRDQACSEVQRLQSQAALSDNANTGPISGLSLTPKGGMAASTSGTAGVSAAKGSSGTIASGSGYKSTLTIQSLPSQAAGTLEGGFFSQPGAATLMTGPANQVLNALAANALQTEGLASLIKKATDPRAAEMATRMGNIAQLAQQEAPSLMAGPLARKGLMTNTADTYSAPAGGGPGGGTLTLGFAPNSSLYGSPLVGLGGGTVQETQFNKGLSAKNSSVAGDDIYHAGWPGSIFDIITVRLKESRDRVDKLEWASPLNRALMGLPNKPISGGSAKK